MVDIQQIEFLDGIPNDLLRHFRMVKFYSEIDRDEDIKHFNEAVKSECSNIIDEIKAIVINKEETKCHSDQ